MRIANLRKIFSSCSSISCWVSQGVQGVTMIKAEDIFPELWLDFGQGLWGQLHCNDNEVPYAIVRQVAIHSVSGAVDFYVFCRITEIDGDFIILSYFFAFRVIKWFREYANQFFRQ